MDAEPRSRTAPLAWLVLLGLAGGLFFVRLDLPLLEPEEARYAEIPRQMLEAGVWLTPRLHDETYHHKPPLFYWLLMLAYQRLGVHDWAARLVVGSIGVATVAATFAWAKSTVGTRAAFLGTLFLVLSPRFVYQARMVNLDGLLTLAIVGTWASLQRAWNEPERRRWWLVAGAACGLGLLAKGPVALLLGTLPALVGQVRTRSGSVRGWGLFTLSWLLVAAPWYGVFAWRNWHAFVDFVWLHHFQRYVDPLDHAKPAWFYLPYLLLGSAPWSLLAGLWLWDRCQGRTDRLSANAGYFGLTFLACVLFYSLSSCKRPGYILPAFPGLAMWLGAYAERRWSTRPHLAWLVPTVVGLATVAFWQFRAPGYFEQYSLRRVLEPLQELASSEGVAIASYPKRWDAIGFYLEKPVEVFQPGRVSGPTLLIVKRGPWLEEVQRQLPGEWSSVAVGRANRKVAALWLERSE